MVRSEPHQEAVSVLPGKTHHSLYLLTHFLALSLFSCLLPRYKFLEAKPEFFTFSFSIMPSKRHGTW